MVHQVQIKRRINTMDVKTIVNLIILGITFIGFLHSVIGDIIRDKG